MPGVRVSGLPAKAGDKRTLLGGTDSPRMDFAREQHRHERNELTCRIQRANKRFTAMLIHDWMIVRSARVQNQCGILPSREAWLIMSRRGNQAGERQMRFQWVSVEGEKRFQRSFGGPVTVKHRDLQMSIWQ